MFLWKRKKILLLNAREKESNSALGKSRKTSGDTFKIKLFLISFASLLFLLIANITGVVLDVQNT